MNTVNESGVNNVILSTHLQWPLVHIGLTLEYRFSVAADVFVFIIYKISDF